MASGTSYATSLAGAFVDWSSSSRSEVLGASDRRRCRPTVRRRSSAWPFSMARCRACPSRDHSAPNHQQEAPCSREWAVQDRMRSIKWRQSHSVQHVQVGVKEATFLE